MLFCGHLWAVDKLPLAKAASPSDSSRAISTAASRSAAASRPRETHARRAPLRARPRSPACGGKHVAGDREQLVRLGRPFDERDHRAVGEVHVDAVSAAPRRAAIEDAAGEEARTEADEAEEPTLRHSRAPSSGAGSAWQAP